MPLTPTLWQQSAFRLTAFATAFFFVASSLSANATEPKKPEWLASCPNIVDTTPNLPTPKTINLVFQNSGQQFKLLKRGTTDFVTEPTSVIGCYVVAESIIKADQSPQWQIGSFNRDNSGYYFQNAAGRIWRLTLSSSGMIFEIQPGSTYYKTPGMGFRIDGSDQLPADCKMADYRMGALRLGFPRNPNRVPAIGESKNLILVLDYSDAPLTGDITQSVKNVLDPELTAEFFSVSSYGKLKLTFDIHPTVVRVKDLEKSYAQQPDGGFMVNGVKQDDKLMAEALTAVNSQADVGSYHSLNFFAPTGLSLGYYGGAHLDRVMTTRSKPIINSQMVNGGIGTVTSNVPSWKVFAHEYGHLLGMFDLYVQGSGNTGKSPGPFDLMGNTSGNSNTFLGFNRWVQGWLTDNDVICETGNVSAKSFSLSPINSISGKRIYVRPISATKAIVIEHRTDSKFDQLGVNAGLLVYTIDFTIASIKGAVTIAHSEGDSPTIFNSDVERYRAATLTQGQYLTVDGVSVYADAIASNQASFSVMTPAELTALLAAKNKPVVTPPTVKSKKTITCISGAKKIKVKAIKPKCPTGFKKR